MGSLHTTWNTNKEGGWAQYKEDTEKNEKLLDISAKNINNATETMKKIDQVVDKCKFKAFGKVKVKTTPLINKDVDDLFKKKSNLIQQGDDSTGRDEKLKDLDKTIAEKLLKKQREKLETEIAKLKDMKDKKGKSAIVFNLKEQVIGSKKAQQEPAVMKDPATKEIVTDVEEIKKISLGYCVDLLTNSEPKLEYEELIEMKKTVYTKKG